MADLRKLEFFLLRYVPDAVKEEFVNVGVVMLEPGANGEGFSDVRFRRDWRRVRDADPQADIEMLEALERDIQKQLSEAGDRDKLLQKMEDSFSNLVQVSRTKACLTLEPAKEIETLASLYFDGPKRMTRPESSERQRVLRAMRGSFEQAGVWASLMKNIPTAPYTRPGDPFKFDFGYRIGSEIKFFHALSLKSNLEQSITLAARFPAITKGIREVNQILPSLTVVVDDRVHRDQESVQFALSMMEDAKIGVAALAEMPRIAEAVRQELRL